MHLAWPLQALLILYVPSFVIVAIAFRHELKPFGSAAVPRRRLAGQLTGVSPSSVESCDAELVAQALRDRAADRQAAAAHWTTTTREQARLTRHAGHLTAAAETAPQDQPAGGR